MKNLVFSQVAPVRSLWANAAFAIRCTCFDGYCQSFSQQVSFC